MLGPGSRVVGKKNGLSPHGLLPFVQTHSNYSFLLIHYIVIFLPLAVTFQFGRSCIKANWFYASVEKSMKKHSMPRRPLESVLFLPAYVICRSLDMNISMADVCIYYKYSICQQGPQKDTTHL